MKEPTRNPMDYRQVKREREREKERQRERKKKRERDRERRELPPTTSPPCFEFGTGLDFFIPSSPGFRMGIRRHKKETQREDPRMTCVLL